MPPRIPTEADFAPLATTLSHVLHFPSPPESTTAILIIFHGLGDHEAPFASFARNMALPGVLAISVRGTSPLPPSLMPTDMDADGSAAPARHFHWGDDLTLDPATGDLDPDPGYAKAARLIMDKLVQETLVNKCGWELGDVLFFGFGQGGSLALGLASQLRLAASRVVDVTEDSGGGPSAAAAMAFKGVVSIGGPLPASMVPTSSAREPSQTSVLVCQLDDEDGDAVKKEFRDVRVVKWKRSGISMPQNSEEVLPLMKFFADRLKSGF